MEELKLKHKKYEVLEDLGSFDLYDALRLVRKNKKYTYKKYKSIAGYNDEMDRYTQLVKAGIRVPKIIDKDKKTLEVIFDYLEGERCDSLLVKNDFELPEIYYERLFIVYRFCRFSKIELNYLPENFVLKNDLLYYDSLDIYNQNSKINLENYGLHFWIKSAKAYEHLEKLGYKFEKKQILKKGEANKKIVLLSIKYW